MIIIQYQKFFKAFLYKDTKMMHNLLFVFAFLPSITNNCYWIFL